MRVLQSGPDVTSPGTDYLDAILYELTSGLGTELFGLFVASFVFIMLYYASDGRFGVPAVVMTLAGGWLVAEVPAAYRGAPQVIVIVGLAAGVWAMMRRYFLRPSA